MKKFTWIHIAFFVLAGLPLLLLFTSCNSTKKLPEGALLLDKNKIIDKTSGADKSDMASYIKQKPNRKMLVWKLYLHIYNSVNIEKMEKKKVKKSERTESTNARRIERNKLKNEKRASKGKKQKQVALKKKNTLTWREWLLSIGEPPAIYDSTLSRKSAKQINMFLNNKGFFNSTVKDSLVIRNKKAIVHYIVQEGKPYFFRNLSYDIKDQQVKYYVLSDTSASLIKKGDQYDADVLQKERDRITTMLRNDGYYYFSKEYIYYEVDSSLGTHEVDISLGIKNPTVKVEGQKDSTVETGHARVYINNLYIYTNYDSKLKSPPSDTLIKNDYYLMSTGELRYKPHLITDAIFISKGELYQQSHADQTYRRLSELKMFRTVQLQFVPVGNDKLDCHIYLSNNPQQSFSAETEGTNTSGTLGIAGNLVYQNKNTFKGGEVFEVKLKGALEVQKTKSQEENISLTGIESPIPFNTLELGGEANLIIPRFLTPFNLGSKSNNAKTNLTGTYNFQRRPDFGRSVANTAFGYSWKETSTKRHIINPIEFNLVNIFNPSSNLQTTIDNSKDLFLKNSYSDHFTLGSRYAFIFSNQDILRKQKNFSYLRVGAEGAGNAMRGIFELIDNNIKPLDYDYDSVLQEKNYTIENIRFSQYVRFDFDYRYYKQLLNEKDKFVYRFAFGIGKPFSNLRVLPLEKSFFSGGPNSIRAWQARTLGPGGYVDTTNSNFADKIGDVKLEGNFEYRFNVVKILNAALFVDAGNIWLRKPYESYPGGEFQGDKFIGQIAMGAGMGFRLDFNFFIIRLDGAFKLKDPALPVGDRWTLGKQPLNHAVLNFGIGYPF